MTSLDWESKRLFPAMELVYHEKVLYFLPFSTSFTQSTWLSLTTLTPEGLVEVQVDGRGGG